MQTRPITDDETGATIIVGCTAPDTAPRARLGTAPAWLRYWTPCPEHVHGTTAADGRLVDSAIRGWRWDQSHAGAPRHGTPAVADWNALQIMRGVIHECAECRCATASAASQAALELADTVPNVCSPARLADRFRNVAGPMFTGPEMDQWKRRTDARNADARACGFRSIWEPGAAEAVDNRADAWRAWIEKHPEIAEANAASVAAA